jgi:endo-1,4-beta-xylanase
MVSTTTPGEFFGGGRALKVNVNGTQGGADAWRIQLASDLVATEIGATYTVTAWVKSSAASTIRFSTQPSALYGPNAALTTSWQMISWSFIANVAETRVMLDMGGGVNTTHFIDDVKLTKN